MKDIVNFSFTRSFDCFLQQLESQLDMKQGYSKATPSSSVTMPSVSAGVSSSSRDNNRVSLD